MKPARYFVRVWTPDPAEEDADDEKDSDIPDGPEAAWVAKAAAASLRQKGKQAAAFERCNIHLGVDVPPEVSGDDLPPWLWECEAVQIDEDEIERENQAMLGTKTPRSSEEEPRRRRRR